MSILFLIPDRNIDKLITQIRTLVSPSTEIEVWPDVKNPEKVEYVIAWNPPKGSLADLPNLKAIASFGAGVDSIVSYQGLPEVPITRIVDKHLADDMARYVLTHILAYQHHLTLYSAQQKECYWKPKRALTNSNVLILGAGQLGMSVATSLEKNGFCCAVWSKNKKAHTSIASYSEHELEKALQGVDFIVNLLPATTETVGMINRHFFQLVKQGAVFINVARGNIVNETDLIAALDDQQLAHAILDVFTIEPLPKDHALWQHSKITITPHCAALSNIETVSEQLVDNYKRMQEGLTLHNVVDTERQY